MRIALIGMMLSGKTRVSAALTDRLGGFRRIETDQTIERIAGLSVRDIFERQGEQSFRQLESRVLREIASQDDIVVSCGGGLPLHVENREILSSFDFVFYLRATAEQLIARMTREERESRPLLSGDAERTIEWLVPDREPIYMQCCTHVIDANRPVSEIVSAILLVIWDEAMQKKYEFTENQTQ